MRKGGVIQGSEVKKKAPPFLIEVDGGINDITGKECVEAGANVLVAGNYLYKEVKDMHEGIENLRSLGN